MLSHCTCFYTNAINASCFVWFMICCEGYTEKRVLRRELGKQPQQEAVRRNPWLILALLCHCLQAGKGGHEAQCIITVVFFACCHCVVFLLSMFWGLVHISVLVVACWSQFLSWL